MVTIVNGVSMDNDSSSIHGATVINGNINVGKRIMILDTTVINGYVNSSLDRGATLT